MYGVYWLAQPNGVYGSNREPSDGADSGAGSVQQVAALTAPLVLTITFFRRERVQTNV